MSLAAYFNDHLTHLFHVLTASSCLGYYYGTVMIGATAITLRFPLISSNGLWWLIEQKCPASEFNYFFHILAQKEKLRELFAH